MCVPANAGSPYDRRPDRVCRGALGAILIVTMRLRHLSLLAFASVAVGCGASVPQSTNLPTVTGRPVIGEMLTSSRGSWSDGPASYSYHWQVCATATYCTNVSGARSRSYRVRPNDFDYVIRSMVTACRKLHGCSSAFSARTARITGAQPSGMGLPPDTQTDSFGTTWHEVGEDNFTVPAPLGSLGTSSESKVVYVGDHGLRWTEYPDGWGCATKARGGIFYPHCYRPANVLSVHNGVLDFYLHNCAYADGVVAACGANLAPVIPTTGSVYQTYGRYSARFKVIFNDARHLDQYHIAWLLYPHDPSAQPCAESDFPEMYLNETRVKAFAHWGCRGKFDRFAETINLTQWHTFTQEWGPGYRRYYLDGKLVGQSTNAVWRGPERWQLQTEAHARGGDATSGHLLVDWVWIGAPSFRSSRSSGTGGP